LYPALFCWPFFAASRPGSADVESLHDFAPGPEGLTKISQRDQQLQKALARHSRENSGIAAESETLFNPITVNKLWQTTL